MVVIGEATRKLLGKLFELRDLGARDLKGIDGPVRAWAALRPSSIASRFEALMDEAIAWTDEKGAVFWRALVELSKGCVFALPGKASDALQMLTSGIAAWRSTRSTAALPMYGWFTEGFDTLDLKEAKALLDELNA